VKRRATLKMIAIGALGPTMATESSAAAPAILMWLLRAAGLLRGQAAVAGVRATATSAGRLALSSSVIAMRASRAAAALRAVTVVSIGAIATDEVLAHVQGMPDDSTLRWMLAYYAVLTQSDSDAAMGMWSEPHQDPRHFRHLDRVKPAYRLSRLEQRDSLDVRAWVVARNPGEAPTSHVVDIGWTNTAHGLRIASFKSIT
jgi:hypothetical protein